MKNTLIVVTADHDHAIAFNGYPKIGNPILGTVKSYADGKPALAADGKPYTTLGSTAVARTPTPTARPPTMTTPSRSTAIPRSATPSWARSSPMRMASPRWPPTASPTTLVFGNGGRPNADADSKTNPEDGNKRIARAHAI